MAYFAFYCCSAPGGFRCLLLILLSLQQNHLYHVDWFLVTAALTYESGIELSMVLHTVLCGLSQKSEKDERGQRSGVDVSSIVYRPHSVLQVRFCHLRVDFNSSVHPVYMQQQPSVFICQF